MVDTAEADVVGPAITTDDPHAPCDEGVGRGRWRRVVVRCAGPGERSRAWPTARRWRCADPPFRPAGRGSLVAALRRRVGPRDHQERADWPARRAESHAEAELGIVLEQRVVPRRTPAIAVRGPRRRREVGAVDRRAARRVGHDHAVTEQLRDELDVRGLPTAGARPGELEQGLEHLRPLHGVVGQEITVQGRDGLEVLPPASFEVAVGECRLHVDRLVADLGLALGRAHVHADPASGAVVGRDLYGQSMASEILRAELLVEELRRCVGNGSRWKDLHPDGGVRADDRALAAVDADVGVPDRDLLGDRPLLVLGRSRSGRSRQVAGR